MSILGQKILEYTNMYNLAMTKLNHHVLGEAIDKFRFAEKIYVGGNGGSAAISNHLCCDFMKGANLRVMSLSCNTPLITAIGNDLGYEKTLSFQLEKTLTRADLVLLISSSGNSPNIIEAAHVAKRIGAPLVGMTGFDGGSLAQLSDVSIHIPINNYGVVEDCHQSIMHIISQYIAQSKLRMV